MTAHIAIVGGSGFIGSNIGRRLAIEGHRISVLDLAAPPSTLTAEFRAFDMAATVLPTIDWSEFDGVIIAAGLLAGACAADPQRAWEVNVAGTLRVIDALQRSHRCTRVAFLSSAMVYDVSLAAPPFDELAPVAGGCLYRASKLAIESALRVATGSGSLRALVLRPFTVFGHGMSGTRGHLLGRWLELGRKGQPLTVYGNGDQIIDAVPVDFASEACGAWLRDTRAPAFSVVNVSSGAPLRVARLAELLVESGRAAGVVRLTTHRADDSRGWGSIDALQSLLARDLPKDPEHALREFLAGVA